MQRDTCTCDSRGTADFTLRASSLYAAMTRSKSDAEKNLDAGSTDEMTICPSKT